MDKCTVDKSVSAETMRKYGLEPDIVYQAEDGEHEKEGTLIVHLTAPNGTKIEVPVNLMVFQPSLR